MVVSNPLGLGNDAIEIIIKITIGLGNNKIEIIIKYYDLISLEESQNLMSLNLDKILGYERLKAGETGRKRKIFYFR